MDQSRLKYPIYFMSVGDLVWVRFPVSKGMRWIFGYIVELSDEQRGFYKVHLFDFDIATNYFINDIRILEEKTTIYEKEVNK